MAFSDDGARILSAGADRTALLWDTALIPLAVLRGHEDQIWWAAFDADGHPITASRDGTARLWPRTDARLQRDLPADGTISAVAFSSDGRRLIYRQQYWGTGVRLLDLAAPESTPRLLGDGIEARRMAVSPDGRWLAAGDDSETIRLWDLTAPEAPPQVLTPGDEHNYVTAMTFSTNGDTLVALSGGTAYRWNVAQGAYTNPQIVRGLVGRGEATLSPDGRWLAALDEDSPGEIRLWDLTTTPPGRLTRLTTLDDAVTALAFNAKGTLLGAGDAGGAVRLWDLSRPAAPLDFKQIQHQGGVRTLTFSPSGHFLASGGDDGDIHIYEPGASGKTVEPKILRGHEGAIVAMGFSFDDRRLVTAGKDVIRNVTTRFGQTRVQRRDMTLRLWDLSAASEPASIMLSSSADADTVLFNPDGRWLVTTRDTDGGRAASLWDLRLESLVERACVTAGRNLSIAEWRQAMGEVPYRKTCPSLPIHPSLLTEARDLARAGQVDEAIAAYRTAQTLEPGLALDPAAEVQRDTAEAQVERAVALARKGRIQEAVVLIDKARQQAPDIVIAAESWDVMCRYGVLAGQPQLAIPACDQAIALADEPDAFGLGRGVAQALAGNIPGAVDDLTAYLSWAERHELADYDIDRRRQWLDSLKQGGKLFDAQSLEPLLADND